MNSIDGFRRSRYDTRRIVAGPSKWNLLIEALGHFDPVEFTLEGIGPILVRILYIGPDDGSLDKWLMTVQEVRLSDKMALNRTFKVYYDSKTQQGMYEEEGDETGN